MSLVADYSSSGEEDQNQNRELNQDTGTKHEQESDHDEGDEDGDEEQRQTNNIINIKHKYPMSKLPKPDFIGSSTKGSVFLNPFAAAEEAKTAILEKHVKMVPVKDKLQMINGKKICWNYRKGKCRFGHNCTFAHDSDLQKSKEQLETENQVQSTLLYENIASQDQKTGKVLQAQEDIVSPIIKGKKRPGLPQGLVPSKKTMKMYKNQKAKGGHS